MLGADFEMVVSAAGRGDESAFVRLFRDVQPVLLRYLRLLDVNQADDAASETWVEVVKRLAAFEGDERGWRAWVFTVARSKLTDARRRSVRRREDVVGGDAELAAQLGGASAMVADAADGAFEQMGTERALRLVASLPHPQSEIVALRVLAGLDTAATAGLLGMTEGAVRVAQHRALRRLERLLLATQDAGSERGCVTR